VVDSATEACVAGASAAAKVVKFGGIPVNAGNDEQSDAVRTFGGGAALRRPDPQGDGVPMPRRKRKVAVQHARRD
jgi:hypothetical protein